MPDKDRPPWHCRSLLDRQLGVSLPLLEGVCKESNCQAKSLSVESTRPGGTSRLPEHHRATRVLLSTQDAGRLPHELPVTFR